jgi:predicted enzyme related to lactoylglutathione lyase
MGGPVEILSIRWTAVLVEEFKESVRFFQEVMGFPLDLYDEAKQFAFFWWEEELQAFEVFGLDAEAPDEMNCAVAGFQVANLHSARSELEGQSIEFLGETTITPNGSGWAYFIGPDGFVYKLVQASQEYAHIQRGDLNKQAAATDSGTSPAISGIAFFGIPTIDFEQTTKFFEEILKLARIPASSNEHAVFPLPGGESLEIFGPENDYDFYLPCPLVGFRVNDIRSARQTLQARGVTFINEIYEHPNGGAWCDFRDSEGTIFSLAQS